MLGDVFVFVIPFHPADGIAVAAQRYQAQAVGKHFVLDDGGVLEDEDVFDGEGGDFGDEDTAKGIGEGCVNTDEGESEIELAFFLRVLNARILRGCEQMFLGLSSLAEHKKWSFLRF